MTNTTRGERTAGSLLLITFDIGRWPLMFDVGKCQPYLVGRRPLARPWPTLRLFTLRLFTLRLFTLRLFTLRLFTLRLFALGLLSLRLLSRRAAGGLLGDERGFLFVHRQPRLGG